MTLRITQPGIFLDMTAVDYFADPAPTPSLTQSVAKRLIDRSPLHAWTIHPRLNPNFEPDDPTKYDIGNIAHRLLLGRGKELVVIEADDWRTKAAKEAREEAATDGKCGVLFRDYSIAQEMVGAAYGQLSAAGFAADWEDDAGHGEAVLAWREGDLWFRSMVDWLSIGRRRVWDLKTTKASAAPHALAMKMATEGWDVQAAIQERGLDVLDPGNAGRREHYFVCMESDPPYALTISRLPESALTMGRKKLAVAIGIWRECLTTGNWPGYPTEVQTPSYPEFKERQWLDREETEFADVPTRDFVTDTFNILGAG